MRMKSALLVGFPMMTSIPDCVVHTPDRFTETVRGVDVIERIGYGGSIYASYIADGAVDCKATIAKIPSSARTERIDHEDPSIPSPISHRTRRAIIRTNA